MRNPSTYGQLRTGLRRPGICFASDSVVNSTYFALDVGSQRLMKFASGKPTHGITIDQRSTQR